ncbi:MAG: TdeIII family type II restriction endonuclease [Armatimonadota bacterium]
MANVVTEVKEQLFPASMSVRQYLEQRSSEGRLKPFHQAIIPPELMRLSAFERSFSTRLGSTFEECARLIALQFHREAQRGYRLGGKVSRSALQELERQVGLFEHASSSRPMMHEMVEAVLAARRNDDLISLRLVADLWVQRHDGTQLFFEIKSPVPNKGQCLEVTQRLLRVHLVTGQQRPQVAGYFAMAYNPYGASRSDYRWTYARNYMPFEEAVLIGEEFWSLVGTQGVYEELLEIYQEVGQARAKYILDTLAFGF